MRLVRIQIQGRAHSEKSVSTCVVNKALIVNPVVVIEAHNS